MSETIKSMVKCPDTKSEYRCFICASLVNPSAEQIRKLESGELTAITHLGEFVAASARRPPTTDELERTQLFPAMNLKERPPWKGQFMSANLGRSRKRKRDAQEL